MNDATLLLNAITGGDRLAAGKLIPMVYDELRRMARHQLSREVPGHTLEATALVHEAYMRLVGNEDGDHWENRGHFFGAAAEAMRRILVDSARRKRALKRGGNVMRQDLDADQIATPEKLDDPIALDESLNRLAATDSKKAELVKLRFFAGMTIPESAKALGIARSTADAWWSYARAWLHRDMLDSKSESDSG